MCSLFTADGWPEPVPICWDEHNELIETLDVQSDIEWGPSPDTSPLRSG